MSLNVFLVVQLPGKRVSLWNLKPIRLNGTEATLEDLKQGQSVKVRLWEDSSREADLKLQIAFLYHAVQLCTVFLKTYIFILICFLDDNNKARGRRHLDQG
jgi:hypothetical protein